VNASQDHKVFTFKALPRSYFTQTLQFLFLSPLYIYIHSAFTHPLMLALISLSSHEFQLTSLKSLIDKLLKRLSSASTVGGCESAFGFENVTRKRRRCEDGEGKNIHKIAERHSDVQSFVKNASTFIKFNLICRRERKGCCCFYMRNGKFEEDFADF
jgi:hypothetical protein